nr:type II CAAX endopeptidase family protein [uncultured Bacillus sp.]
MKKEYGFILITYITMQLSSIISIPLMSFFGKLLGKEMDPNFAVSSWLVISFTIALIITLFLLRQEMNGSMRNEDALPPGQSVAWAFGGIFLALMAQFIAGNIEYLIGIDVGSENTQQIVNLIQTAPIMILVSSFIGPILEEIVFRKILFGSLYKRFNFFLSGLISSLIFAFAHGEPEHLLLYATMGFTFAFLFVKTKRILVPIFAHVAMNTIVVIMQLNQDWIQQYENIQSFIGGF